MGDSALTNYATGGFSTAVGYGALSALTSGQSNAAFGQGAGQNLATGSNNAYLVNEGVNNESNTIRLGSGLFGHTRLFLAATRGVTTGLNNGAVVLIDGNGQLGTVNSSRRTKEDIADLGGIGFAVQRLRPVQFRYIQPFEDGSKPIQYGLIAEEVEAVLPELVAYGADGQPETVKYHVLPTLLLAEVQRLERERAELTDRVVRQAEQLAAQTVRIDGQRSFLDRQADAIESLRALVLNLQAEVAARQRQ